MEPSCRLTIHTRLDADEARREARHLALALGFDRADAEAVALATSELAMNLHRYAPGGEIEIQVTEHGLQRGIQIRTQDRGPGISDPALALEDGYTTGGGLGSGLPAVRRLMDEFSLQTSPCGTNIVAAKWLTAR